MRNLLFIRGVPPPVRFSVSRSGKKRPQAPNKSFLFRKIQRKRCEPRLNHITNRRSQITAMLDAITYAVIPIHPKTRRATSSGIKQEPPTDTRLEAVDGQLDVASKRKMRQSRDLRRDAEEGEDTVVSANQTLHRTQ